MTVTFPELILLVGSAMERVLAADVKLTTPFVFLGRGRSHKTRFTQKGMLATSHDPRNEY